MIRQVIVVAAAVFLFQSGWACAAESPSRPASKQDLVGNWAMVSVRPTHDKSDPTFFPNQRFRFNPDASMKFITSEKPLTQEWLTKFEQQDPDIDFTVDEKGLLTLTWGKIAHSERAIAAYVQKDIPAELANKMPESARGGLPKKGDVTLSFLNSKGKIAYQKVLRRV